MRTSRADNRVAGGRLWLAPGVLEAMIVEAQRTEPLESGGVLLGWLGPDKTDVMAGMMLGPGPKATHKRARFAPDSSWQRREIARAYEESGRVLSYLGDWHSHPGGGETPSSRDERTARRIARHRAARAPEPLFLILAGGGEEWRPAPYRHVARRLRRIDWQV